MNVFRLCKTVAICHEVVCLRDPTERHHVRGRESIVLAQHVISGTSYSGNQNRQRPDGGDSMRPCSAGRALAICHVPTTSPIW